MGDPFGEKARVLSRVVDHKTFHRRSGYSPQRRKADERVGPEWRTTERATVGI